MIMETTKPTLRFPEFSEVWEPKIINDILKFGSGKDYKHLETGDIPVFGTGGLMTYVNNFLYDGETVCIGRKGTIDKPMFYNGKLWTVDTLFYSHSFNNSTPKFVYYLFQNINWREYSEASGVPSLSKSTIEKIKINIPLVEEQTKIANFLTAIDEKINLLKEKKSLLDDYKKGIMQQIFSQEIKFKNEDGNDFEDWVEIELGEVLDYIQPTKYIVQSTDYDNSFETPVLTAGKTFILGYTDETNNIFSEQLPVIIFDDFTTANKYVDFPFKVKSSAMKILVKKNENIDLKYIYEFIQTLNFSSGDEHKRYWISEYSKCIIQLPKLEEQIKISKFLSAIDDKISLVNVQITEKQEYKKGLLQQMFV